MKRLWLAFAATLTMGFGADTLKALGMADLRIRLEQQGIDPGSSATREEFAAFVKSETVK